MVTSARTMFVACALGLLCSGALVAQFPVTVDYDTFWQLSRSDQVATFNRITPENRSALVRTQIQRWTDANRARLNPEQLQFLAEMLTFISADLYRQPMPDALVARSKEVEARAMKLFSPEDAAAAFTREGGSYIPKP
jgi:hypothetical protein